MTGWQQTIEKVEVERETEKCVWVKRWGSQTASRRNKMSDYECYFDSFDEAKAYLVDAAKRKVTAAEARLQSLKAELKKANDLKRVK